MNHIIPGPENKLEPFGRMIGLETKDVQRLLSTKPPDKTLLTSIIQDWLKDRTDSDAILILERALIRLDLKSHAEVLKLRIAPTYETLK